MSKQYWTLFLLCALPALPLAAQEAPSSQPVAMLNGEPIIESDIVPDAKWWNLEREMYNTRKGAIESFIANRLLDAEAERRGVSKDDLVTAELGPKIGEPTNKEINDYYQAQKAKINRPLKEVRTGISTILKRQKAQLHFQDFVSSLVAKSDVRILIDPPRLPVDLDDARFRGPKDAAVTIVEYSDFQCPYCRRVQPTLAELSAEYEGKVRWAFKDFPLTEIHPEAARAAQAARCADDQGKFWEFRAGLFGQELFTDGTYTELAKGLRMNEKALLECLNSGKHEAAVTEDATEARKFGLTATPAFVVNGVLLSGAQPIEVFRQAIDEELKRIEAP